MLELLIYLEYTTLALGCVSEFLVWLVRTAHIYEMMMPSECAHLLTWLMRVISG